MAVGGTDTPSQSTDNGGAQHNTPTYTSLTLQTNLTGTLPADYGNTINAAERLAFPNGGVLTTGTIDDLRRNFNQLAFDFNTEFDNLQLQVTRNDTDLGTIKTKLDEHDVDLAHSAKDLAQKAFNKILINTGEGLSGGGNLQADRNLAIVVATSSTLGGVKEGGDIDISGAGIMTIKPDAVALGTDTTGQYVSTVTGGIGITATTSSADDATAQTVRITNTLTSGEATSYGSESGTAGTSQNTITLPTFTVNQQGQLTTVGTLDILEANNNTITITAGNGLNTGGNFTTNAHANKTITIHHDARHGDLSDDTPAFPRTTGTANSHPHNTTKIINSIGIDAYGHFRSISKKDITYGLKTAVEGGYDADQTFDLNVPRESDFAAHATRLNSLENYDGRVTVSGNNKIISTASSGVLSLNAAGGTNVTQDLRVGPDTQFSSGAKFIVTNSTGAITSAGDVTIDTNTFKVDTTNNRVGIGTATPAYPLHVDQTINGEPGITLQGADPTFYFYDDTNPTASMKLAYNGSSSEGLTFRVFNHDTSVNGVAALKVGADGNVVAGADFTATGTILTQALNVNNTGTAGVEGRINIKSTKTDATEATFENRFFSRASDGHFGIFDVTNSQVYFRYKSNASAANTKLGLLEGGGQLGIGTATPTTTLDVTGSAAISSNITIGGTIQSGGGGFDVDSSGNITDVGDITSSGAISTTNNISASGTLTVDGNTTLGNAFTDTTNINGDFTFDQGRLTFFEQADTANNDTPSNDRARIAMRTYEPGSGSTNVEIHDGGSDGTADYLVFEKLDGNAVRADGGFAWYSTAKDSDNDGAFYTEQWMRIKHGEALINQPLKVGTTGATKTLFVSGSSEFDGKIRIDNATDATTATDSAASIHTDGGVAITKSLFVGEDISVTDDVTVGDDLTVGGLISVGGTNNTLVTTHAGNVGIKVADPGCTLEAFDTGEAAITIRTSGTSDAVLNLQAAGSYAANNGWTMRLDNSDSDKLQWRHDNSQKMTLQTDGNLGIGTTTPDTKLHVAGNGKFIKLGGNSVIIEAGDDGTQPSTTAVLSIKGYEDRGIGTFLRTTDANTDSSGLDNTEWFIGRPYQTRGGLQFGYSADNTSGVNGAEYNAQSKMYIQTDGKVGIGTVTPGVQLHVNSGTENGVALFESTDTEAAISLKDTTGTSVIRSRGDFRFDTKDGEVVRMQNDGNVGIGTTSPSFKLDVNGSLGAGNIISTGTDFKMFNSTRASGTHDGRVAVHNVNDLLTLNYGNDFTLGTSIGGTTKDNADIYIKHAPNSRTDINTNNINFGPNNSLKIDVSGTDEHINFAPMADGSDTLIQSTVTGQPGVDNNNVGFGISRHLGDQRGASVAISRAGDGRLLALNKNESGSYINFYQKGDLQSQIHLGDGASDRFQIKSRTKNISDLTNRFAINQEGESVFYGETTIYDLHENSTRDGTAEACLRLRNKAGKPHIKFLDGDGSDEGKIFTTNNGLFIDGDSATSAHSAIHLRPDETTKLTVNTANTIVYNKLSLTNIDPRDGYYQWRGNSTNSEGALFNGSHYADGLNWTQGGAHNYKPSVIQYGIGDNVDAFGTKASGSGGLWSDSGITYTTVTDADEVASVNSLFRATYGGSWSSANVGLGHANTYGSDTSHEGKVGVLKVQWQGNLGDRMFEAWECWNSGGPNRYCFRIESSADSGATWVDRTPTNWALNSTTKEPHLSSWPGKDGIATYLRTNNSSQGNWLRFYVIWKIKRSTDANFYNSTAETNNGYNGWRNMLLYNIRGYYSYPAHGTGNSRLQQYSQGRLFAIEQEYAGRTTKGVHIGNDAMSLGIANTSYFTEDQRKNSLFVQDKIYVKNIGLQSGGYVKAAGDIETSAGDVKAGSSNKIVTGTGGIEFSDGTVLKTASDPTKIPPFSRYIHSLHVWFRGDDELHFRSAIGYPGHADREGGFIQSNKLSSQGIGCLVHSGHTGWDSTNGKPSAYYTATRVANAGSYTTVPKGDPAAANFQKLTNYREGYAKNRGTDVTQANNAPQWGSRSNDNDEQLHSTTASLQNGFTSSRSNEWYTTTELANLRGADPYQARYGDSWRTGLSIPYDTASGFPNAVGTTNIKYGSNTFGFTGGNSGGRAMYNHPYCIRCEVRDEIDHSVKNVHWWGDTLDGFTIEYANGIDDQAAFGGLSSYQGRYFCKLNEQTLNDQHWIIDVNRRVDDSGGLMIYAFQFPVEAEVGITRLIDPSYTTKPTGWDAT